MSLAKKLDDIRAAGDKNIPAPMLAQMHKATEELQNSGILESMVKPGDPLPVFELPNHTDTVIRSAELLPRGPLILTVYRGLW